MGYLTNEPLEEFKERCRNWIRENDPNFDKYPKWLWKEFMDHWTQKNDGGRKHFYQMEKKWSTGGRIATFLKFAQARKDPRLRASKMRPQEVKYTPPKNLSKNNDFTPDYEAYKKRMEKENKKQRGNIAQYLPHNRK